MNRSVNKVLVFLLVFLGTAAFVACKAERIPVSTQPSAPPAIEPEPHISIISPANGAIIASSNITVDVQVRNFQLADKQGQPVSAGQGHIHYYLDASPPFLSDFPNLPSSGVWASSPNTTYDFTNVTLGTHTITVQLVNNDDSSAGAFFYDTIKVMVIPSKSDSKP